MSEELKPCPFCGEKEELYPSHKWPGGGKPFAIDCLGCGIDFTPREGMDVIAAWNRRASDSSVPPSRLHAQPRFMTRLYKRLARIVGRLLPVENRQADSKGGFVSRSFDAAPFVQQPLSAIGCVSEGAPVSGAGPAHLEIYWLSPRFLVHGDHLSRSDETTTNLRDFA